MAATVFEVRCSTHPPYPQHSGWKVWGHFSQHSRSPACSHAAAGRGGRQRRQGQAGGGQGANNATRQVTRGAAALTREGLRVGGRLAAGSALPPVNTSMCRLNRVTAQLAMHWCSLRTAALPLPPQHRRGRRRCSPQPFRYPSSPTSNRRRFFQCFLGAISAFDAAHRPARVLRSLPHAAGRAGTGCSEDAASWHPAGALPAQAERGAAPDGLVGCAPLHSTEEPGLPNAAACAKGLRGGRRWAVSAGPAFNPHPFLEVHETVRALYGSASPACGQASLGAYH